MLLAIPLIGHSFVKGTERLWAVLSSPAATPQSQSNTESRGADPKLWPYGYIDSYSCTDSYIEPRNSG